MTFKFVVGTKSDFFFGRFKKVVFPEVKGQQNAGCRLDLDACVGNFVKIA